MDSERIEATEETQRRFREPWFDETVAPKVWRADIGPGEGAEERTMAETEGERETWKLTDGGMSDTTSTLRERMRNLWHRMRRTNG